MCPDKQSMGIFLACMWMIRPLVTCHDENRHHFANCKGYGQRGSPSRLLWTFVRDPATLDMTIQALGTDVTWASEIHALREVADAKCAHQAVYSSSEQGELRSEAAKDSCYSQGAGCGYKCIDLILLAQYSSVIKWTTFTSFRVRSILWSANTNGTARDWWTMEWNCFVSRMRLLSLCKIRWLYCTHGVHIIWWETFFGR